MTGKYMGNPQSQAAKSREHLKTASDAFQKRIDFLSEP